MLLLFDLRATNVYAFVVLTYPHVLYCPHILSYMSLHTVLTGVSQRTSLPTSSFYYAFVLQLCYALGRPFVWSGTIILFGEHRARVRTRVHVYVHACVRAGVRMCACNYLRTEYEFLMN